MDRIITEIDIAIGLYNRGLISVEYCTRRATAAIEQGTEDIPDINTRIKAQNALYKRFFYKMHKTIIRTERR